MIQSIPFTFELTFLLYFKFAQDFSLASLTIAIGVFQETRDGWESVEGIQSLCNNQE